MAVDVWFSHWCGLLCPPSSDSVSSPVVFPLARLLIWEQSLKVVTRQIFGRGLPTRLTFFKYPQILKDCSSVSLVFHNHGISGLQCLDHDTHDRAMRMVEAVPLMFSVVTISDLANPLDLCYKFLSWVFPFRLVTKK